MSLSRTQNVKRNILSGLINKCIVLAIPFITRTVIIWKLGAEFLGLSSLFGAILQVLNMAELGFSSAIVFSLYKPVAEGNQELVCALMNYYRKIYRIVGMVVLVAGVLVTPFVTKLIKGSYPDTINVYFLYLMYLMNTVISYWAFAYKNALLIADQRAGIVSNIDTIVTVLRGIIQIITLVLLGNYYIFYFCVIIGTILNNLFVALYTDRNYPDYRCKGELNEEFKQNITRQIKGLAIGKVSVTARNSFDSIFLSMFCGLIDVAIYSNYYYIYSAILGMVQMIRIALTASVGNSIAVRSVEDNYRLFKRLNYYLLIITSFCTVCLVSLYQPFMRRWAGEKLTAEFSIAIMFGIYFYITGCAQIRSVFQEGAGLWWEVRNYSIAEALINIVFNAVLGKLYGMHGILIATLISVTGISVIGMGKATFKLYFKKKASEYFLEIIIMGGVTAIISAIAVVVLDALQLNVGANVFNLITAFVITAFIAGIALLLLAISVPQYRRYTKLLFEGGFRRESV